MTSAGIRKTRTLGMSNRLSLQPSVDRNRAAGETTAVLANRLPRAVEPDLGDLGSWYGTQDGDRSVCLIIDENDWQRTVGILDARSAAVGKKVSVELSYDVVRRAPVRRLNFVLRDDLAIRSECRIGVRSTRACAKYRNQRERNYSGSQHVISVVRRLQLCFICSIGINRAFKKKARHGANPEPGLAAISSDHDVQAGFVVNARAFNSARGNGNAALNGSVEVSGRWKVALSILYSLRSSKRCGPSRRNE